MMTQCWPNARPQQRGVWKLPKDISTASAVLYAAVCAALGGIVVAMITAFNDWRKDRRASSLDKRKGETAGVEAQLEHEDKFQASLLTRIETLERRDDERNQREREREQKISSLQLDMESMRGQMKALVLRMEAAIGGEPGLLVSELREVLIGFRTLLDMAPVPRPVIAGTAERTHTEELTNPMFLDKVKRRATDLEKGSGE